MLGLVGFDKGGSNDIAGVEDGEEWRERF